MTDIAPPPPPNDDYDSPWKDMLEHAFPEFMAFFFPDAYAQIDWAQGYEFLPTELRQIVRDAELGKRHADALVRVTLRNGTASCVYSHVEVQGQHDLLLDERMFVYNYRFYDCYKSPIASFAVLADDNPNWRPDHFGYAVLGCQVGIQFPCAKLLDYADRIEQLATDPNPFALITVAHLRTRETRHDPHARYQAKQGLVRQLYRLGLDRQGILDLFAVIDWMMRLPDGLEQKLWQDIQQIEGEQNMRYVTSVERLATERGMQQGMQQGMQIGKVEWKLEGKVEGELGKAANILERLLTKRFGPLPEPTRLRLQTATLDQLDAWTERILDAPSLNAIFENH